MDISLLDYVRMCFLLLYFLLCFIVLNLVLKQGFDFFFHILGFRLLIVIFCVVNSKIIWENYLNKIHINQISSRG